MMRVVIHVSCKFGRPSRPPPATMIPVTTCQAACQAWVAHGTPHEGSNQPKFIGNKSRR